MSNSSVQEVRDRIIQLAREIEDFSKSNVPPKTFFNEFLKRVVGAVGARAGVVWMRNGSNRLEMFAELGLSNTTFNETPTAPATNQKLLNEVISNGQACTYSPDETSVELPTSDMLVLAALQQNKEVVGVVEVFQRNDTPVQARPGFLQFVEQMTGYACRFLDRQTAPEDEAPGTVSKVAAEFEQFVLQLHKSLDVKEVAGTAANDARLLIGCDRLSVAVLDGKKAVVRSVSGQQTVNQRANLVRRMTKLAQRVIATKEKMVYTGKVDHLAPKVETALGDFIQESGSRMVMVIPVFEPEALIEKDEEHSRPKEKIRKPVGGLIVEQIAESQPKPGVAEKSELIADHVGSAIFNAKQYNRLFLMPVWRGIGRGLSFLEGRNGLKAALILAVLAAVVATMCLVPMDYRVTGEGRLMPVGQADAFAPWDGEVVNVLVDNGTHVDKGQTIVIMESKDLEEQYERTLGQLNSARVELAKLAVEHGRLNAVPGQEAEKVRIQGQYGSTSEQVKHLERMKSIIEDRIEQLTIKAPISGVVVTFQAEQLLLNRPVRRGEVLLEIKDDSKTSDWRLELDVDEHRMGHLLNAQGDFERDDLHVEYYLATSPEDTYEGNLHEVSTRTNSSEDGGSVVTIFATLNKNDLPKQKRIGAEVRAKINCGKMSMGYVLFGDVVEFVQKYFWL